MKKDIAKKWVAALRSGKYKQGRSMLKKIRAKKTRYCCLGVLCNISKQGKWIESVNNSKYTDYVCKDGSYTSTSLPSQVQKWANVDKNFASNASSIINTLVKMNDEEKKTFKSIANFIETNYKKL